MLHHLIDKPEMVKLIHLQRWRSTTGNFRRAPLQTRHPIPQGALLLSESQLPSSGLLASMSVCDIHFTFMLRKSTCPATGDGRLATGGTAFGEGRLDTAASWRTEAPAHSRLASNMAWRCLTACRQSLLTYRQLLKIGKDGWQR